MSDNCAKHRDKIAELKNEITNLQGEVADSTGPAKQRFARVLQQTRGQLAQEEAALVECENRTPPPSGILTVVSHNFQIRPELEITGSKFTPKGTFHLTISNMPGKIGDILRAHSFDAKGAFQIIESFDIATVSVDAILPNIIVSIRDDVSGRSVAQEISPDPFVVRI